MTVEPEESRDRRHGRDPRTSRTAALNIVKVLP
jgi:hypothetical protein